jgi:hypothetical protein
MHQELGTALAFKFEVDFFNGKENTAEGKTQRFASGFFLRFFVGGRRKILAGK